MNRIGVVLAVAVMAGALPCSASCPDAENALGVYFDQESYTDNCFEPPVLTGFNLYFVLQHGTLPDLGAIGFSWRLASAPAASVGAAWWICGTDLWDTYNVAIACPAVPMADTLPILTIHVILLEPLAAASFVQVGPLPSSPIPGAAVLGGGDPMTFIPLNFCDDWDGADVEIDADGWTVPGVAALAPLGGCGTVAVLGATWGTIKSLYH